MIRKTLCVLFAISTPVAAQSAGSAPPPLGRMVDVDGHRVHVYCTGTGSPTTVITGAGYSFDWDLVQTAASKDGRVCSYDPAGSAWSPPSSTPTTCASHLSELHSALEAAGVHDKVVLVGQSIGAVFARLYAARYPSEVAGMVLVDHAAVIRMANPAVGRGGSTVLPPGVVLGRGVTLPPGVTLSAPNASSDPGQSPYGALPPRDRALHDWADSLPSSESPRARRAFFDQCTAEADSISARRRHPLGDTPLVDIRLPIADSGYRDLHQRLLALSTNSVAIVADSSGHLVHIDRPEVVARAIAKVRSAARNHQPLARAHASRKAITGSTFVARRDGR